MPDGAVPRLLTRFSTHDLPERDRLPMWREEFGRSIVRVDIHPLERDGFRAEATLRALPGLRTIDCAGSTMTFHRTAAQAAQGEEGLGLIVGGGGKSVVTQRGQESILADGDALPVFTDEPGFLAGSRHIGLLVPRSAIRMRVRNLETMRLRKIPRSAAPLQLLMSYLSALPQGEALEQPKLQGMVTDHIHDLIALVLTPETSSDSIDVGGVRAARLDLALRHIRDSFARPDFDLAAAARMQKITPRYLQLLLERTGTTFSERVKELRLQRSLALLAAPGERRRISDIALEAGFSDISHFNRLFRSRFGDTPRNLRGHELRSASLWPSSDAAERA